VTDIRWVRGEVFRASFSGPSGRGLRLVLPAVRITCCQVARSDGLREVWRLKGATAVLFAESFCGSAPQRPDPR